MISIALAGNPNSGKTTLFNTLTGSTAHVGNWPGVTVDRREGVYKKGKEPVTIVDLPGIYSLSPYTPEEVISREYILKGGPNCVIDVVDATNLERNLYLATQLMEADIPLVIALNMSDVLKKEGDSIDVARLEKEMGVPVVEISALRGVNVDELIARAVEESKKPRHGVSVLATSDLYKIIQKAEKLCEEKRVPSPLFHAIKLVEKDEEERKNHPDLAERCEEMMVSAPDFGIFGKDTEAFIADHRYKYITEHFSPCLTRAKKKEATFLTKSDKADKILTNKWLGLPLLLVVLFSIFHLTFSEDLLYLGTLIPAFGSWAESMAETSVGSIFFTGGLNSPGVIFMNALCLLTDTLSELASSALTSAGASEWAIGLVCDGVLAGLFSVLSFLPQILVLFLLFSILEDSGYMARVAFILDKLFRRFGVSGRAFLPMIMGFGCSVPAMINTRTLADDKERQATIRVIPFFSCGAKLPILTAIAGGIVARFGVANADLITYGMYLLGMVVAVLSLLIMRGTTMRGEIPPFIMELPAYRAPGVKNLLLHLWDKAKHFIEKAFTIILASTIVIWFLSSFSFDWKYVGGDMDQSILASIGKLILPLFTPLGFGSQLSGYGWVFAVAAVTGLIAKENVVATFFTLASCIVALAGSGSLVGLDPALAEEIMALIESGEGSENGVLEAIAIIQATGIKVPALLSFIAFNMTTIPCFAAVATAKAELPKGKLINTIAFWLFTSFAVSSAIYTIGTWWWTVFPWTIALALVIGWIAHLNKKEAKR